MLSKGQKLICLALLLSTSCLSAHGAIQGFEGKDLPEGIHCTGTGSISLSRACSKDGVQSLHWHYHGGDELILPLPPGSMTARIWRDGGLRFWLYRKGGEGPAGSNRTVSGPIARTSAATSSAARTAGILRIDLLDASGAPLAGFDYHMQQEGWRACWMAFRRMHPPLEASPAAPKGAGTPGSTLPTVCRLQAPDGEGDLWLDRLVLPDQKADPRTTPDAQTPQNALVPPLALGHWSSLWRWEQQLCDLPLLTPDTHARQEMELISQRLDAAWHVPLATEADRQELESLWQRFRIRESPTCGGFEGAPLVCADECRPAAGEVSLRELNRLMELLARASAAGAATAEERYLLLWRYALDQGFCFGSGMGTNHHYGYATRWIFRSAWFFRRALARHPDAGLIRAALTYWAGLQETRLPLAVSERADRCDGWNTLLLPRLAAAMLEPDLPLRERHLRCLARWVNASTESTPGTLGGIKADGTVFHHSGFYPAYANDGLDALGRYAELCAGTAYGLSPAARTQFRRALETLRNCSNLRDWPLGLAGRHPFRFGMSSGCVEAYRRLAALEKGEPARSLMRDYRRLSQTIPAAQASSGASAQAPLRRSPSAPGPKTAPPPAPEGFFAYNHAAAGAYRTGEALVFMKGFNRDVWGSEIYTNDNRYGRYQSYGSVCILAGGSPVTQQASGFAESGWDWNRIPGATTIHLPLDELESPRSSTLMAFNPRPFAGAAPMDADAGMFAIDLQEIDEPHFTPDFTARKSVFCCSGQLLCLGSAISNSNARYNTETTLFQCVSSACSDNTRPPRGWLHDGTGNFFRILEGQLRQASGMQLSRDNKTRRETQGSFRTAWLDHGKAPSAARYAYLILVQPDNKTLRQAAARIPFEIVELSDTLHAARHRESGTWAYAAFEDAQAARGPVAALPAGLIVLCRGGQNAPLRLSVTNPALNLPRHGRDISEAGECTVHEVRLRGAWCLAAGTGAGSVTLLPRGAETILRVSCRLGLPVELQLLPQ